MCWTSLRRILITGMYCPISLDFICSNPCLSRFQVHLDCVQFYASSDNVSLLPLVVRLNSVKAPWYFRHTHVRAANCNGGRLKLITEDPPFYRSVAALFGSEYFSCYLAKIHYAFVYSCLDFCILRFWLTISLQPLPSSPCVPARGWINAGCTRRASGII